MHLVIGEMVHSRYRCLRHMLEYLDSDPRTHSFKKLGRALPVCISSAVRLLRLAVECPNSRFGKRSYLGGIKRES